MSVERFPQVGEYLTPHDTAIIERWVTPLEPLIEKYPHLKNVDLVVEGGIGTGQTMPHIVRRLFPCALYVATDLSREIVRSSRLLGQIDDSTLQRVVLANLSPSIAMSNTIIFANCFDKSLVLDIARKTGRTVPFLVSYHSLGAFIDRSMNPWYKKDTTDTTSLRDMVGSESPFCGQLYLAPNEFGSEEDKLEQYANALYYKLAEIAQENGWHTEMIKDWIIMLRS